MIKIWNILARVFTISSDFKSIKSYGQLMSTSVEASERAMLCKSLPLQENVHKNRTFLKSEGNVEMDL